MKLKLTKKRKTTLADHVKKGEKIEAIKLMFQENGHRDLKGCIAKYHSMLNILNLKGRQ